MKNHGAPGHVTYLLDLPEPARILAAEGARLAFPDGEIRPINEVTEIPLHPGPRCLAVLGQAGAVAGLIAPDGEVPRCAVIMLGTGAADLVETVPPAEWNAPLLARVFRSALLQHELLCETLRLRGDLKTVARRISHDLRTPLGCIHTTADILPELDADSLAGMAGVIKQSSEEISQIIDRVSFVLKASADPLPPVPVDMGRLVEGVLRQLEPDIKQARATVSLPASWPETAGVAPWLQAIWWNLLHNALRHGGGGAGAQVRLGWERQGTACRFSVCDHGAGVPSERQAALFSPFDQLHATRTTGLGLSLVQRLTGLQGGRCAYEKTPGGEVCFSFTLPAVDTAA